jgi:hypothetical protein
LPCVILNFAYSMFVFYGLIGVVKIMLGSLHNKVINKEIEKITYHTIHIDRRGNDILYCSTNNGEMVYKSHGALHGLPYLNMNDLNCFQAYKKPNA